jgi:hypothetical protein
MDEHLLLQRKWDGQMTLDNTLGNGELQRREVNEPRSPRRRVLGIEALANPHPCGRWSRATTVS